MGCCFITASQTVRSQGPEVAPVLFFIDVPASVVASSFPRNCCPGCFRTPSPGYLPLPTTDRQLSKSIPCLSPLTHLKTYAWVHTVYRLLEKGQTPWGDTEGLGSSLASQPCHPSSGSLSQTHGPANYHSLDGALGLCTR